MVDHFMPLVNRDILTLISGIRVSRRIALQATSTRLNLVGYTNSSSPLAILESLPTTSSTSLMPTRVVRSTSRSSSVRSVSPVGAV